MHALQCHRFGECNDARKVILFILDWDKHWWATGYSPGSAPVSYTMQVLAFWDMVIPAGGGERGAPRPGCGALQMGNSAAVLW